MNLNKVKMNLSEIPRVNKVSVPQIDEIFAFQFEVKDRQKVYYHASCAKIKITCINYGHFLLAIWLPPKKIIGGSPLLDMVVIKKYYSFIDALNSVGINFHLSAYGKKHYFSTYPKPENI